MQLLLLKSSNTHSNAIFRVSIYRVHKGVLLGCQRSAYHLKFSLEKLCGAAGWSWAGRKRIWALRLDSIEPMLELSSAVRKVSL